MSVRTRRTAALTVGLSLTAALTLALPGTASASTSATVLSSSSYVDGAGFGHIVGEVADTGTTNLDNPSLAFNFYDANGQLLDTDLALALADRLAPGEKAPFHEMFQEPAGYDHYTVSAFGAATTAAPNHTFTTAVTSTPVDAFGDQHLVGTVRNDNTTVANDVKTIFTFYDAAGTVVDSASTPVNPNGTASLAPGATGDFDASGFSGPAYASYAILSESSSDPTPAAPAAPTPTGTNPAPSSSSSTTETPPTVSVAPSTISAGQRVTVTYRGTPNTTLDVYSKTQPATAYSKITTVTLDASGVGTTSHAPRRNTRIMAKTAGGLASTQPLISVRSIASINAKRIGTRTYTFSGSVLPALNQRLVNIYRNGTLIAQTRTNASGVYAVTRKLSGGTFGFQARTPNDTYNLGASSPARSLRIY